MLWSTMHAPTAVVVLYPPAYPDISKDTSTCLSVELPLLYLIGDPEDPGVVWKKLQDQFQKKTWTNKLAL